MDQYRGSNRDLYSSQGNGMGSRGGPYTPRGRGGFQRGDAHSVGVGVSGIFLRRSTLAYTIITATRTAAWRKRCQA